jgi:hypothetical protein
MPGKRVKERLAQDIALWAADGLVDAPAVPVLRARYDAPGFGWVSLVKTFGIAGGIVAGLGVLGLIGSLSGSELVGALLALGVAVVAFWAGLSLSLDPKARAVHSAKVILALAVLFLSGAVAVLAHAASAQSDTILVAVGLVCLPIAFILAYLFQNTFLLVLALLGLFHWVGSYEEMLGRSTYSIEIQDPRAMAVVAAGAIAIGLWHERKLRRSTLRFFQAYQAVGLLYLDLSLLILTIDSHSPGAWIAVFTVACLVQIVLGAWLKSGLLSAFGVTALAIDLFTRYFETFWDRLDVGLFFLIGGALLFGFSVLCERELR